MIRTRSLGRCVFKIFGHIYLRGLRKNQCDYYNTFITIAIGLSMKHKRCIRFSYEIQRSMVTPTRKCSSAFYPSYQFFTKIIIRHVP